MKFIKNCVRNPPQIVQLVIGESMSSSKTSQFQSALPLAQPTLSGDEATNLRRLADTPELHATLDQLFPSLTALLKNDTHRRRFLQLMGASLGLAGLTGCRWPKEEILPYTDVPEGRIPGVPVQYATAIDIAGSATGLLVTSYDGRPTKIEGNPDHPSSRGKTNVWQQASILDLYDPDRSTHPVERKKGTSTTQSWSECTKFIDDHFALLREAQGGGLAVIAGASSSPSRAQWVKNLVQGLPQTRFFEIESLSRDAQRAGTKLAFGRPLSVAIDLTHAERIVSLDSDFLMHHPQSLTLAGEFAAGRRGDKGKLSRLIIFESNYSVTGSMADDRFPVPRSQIGAIAFALLAEVSQLAGQSKSKIDLPEPGELGELSAVIQKLAVDLWQHRGNSVVLAGDQQPAEVHAIAQYLNALLEASPAIIEYREVADEARPTHAQALDEFEALLDSGKVESLLILDCNLAGGYADERKLTEAIRRVPNSIHLGCYRDETGEACQWHVPQAHYLESWNDARDARGVYSLVQPLIDPLYDGKTICQILAWLATGKLPSAYELTQQSFAQILMEARQAKELTEKVIASAWRKTLHDGLLENSSWPVVEPELQPLADSVLSFAKNLKLKPAAGFELNFVPDYSLLDGRFANNGWLQELPDPITKLTWDNAALLSPHDAAKIGIKKSGDLVRIEVADKVLEIPAIAVAGHARGTVTLALGYGRSSAAGVIADSLGTRLLNLIPLQGSSIEDARVVAAGRHQRLAFSQDNPGMASEIGDQEKLRRVRQELIKIATVEQLQSNPELAKAHIYHAPLWQDWSYDEGHKWGMSVDLSACIGCGGCVVACQAENNVPVVGKDEVAIGRIMHWLRIDRYFDSGDVQGRALEPSSDTYDWSTAALSDASIRVHHQPMTCHHCEAAPCEQVCPVAATVHDQEGLSIMVYSRCIGTRYCNNNCPFRVRRFNWFWNQHGPSHPRSEEPLTPVEKMVHNPNVTVRSRGVMEKCSFCSQRINAAKIQAKNNGQSRLRDGAVVPACAQACPTNAIVFGDLNNADSRVRQTHADKRAYELLPELNLKSRLLYLVKLVNPGFTASPDRWTVGHAQHKPDAHESQDNGKDSHKSDRSQHDEHNSQKLPDKPSQQSGVLDDSQANH